MFLSILSAAAGTFSFCILVAETAPLTSHLAFSAQRAEQAHAFHHLATKCVTRQPSQRLAMPLA
jgi:hypothetical protein